MNYTKKELDALAITTLKSIAKDLKIKGYTTFKSDRKQELIEKILSELKNQKAISPKSSIRRVKKNVRFAHPNQSQSPRSNLDNSSESNNSHFKKLMRDVEKLDEKIIQINLKIGEKLSNDEKISGDEIYKYYDEINREYLKLEPREMFVNLKDFYERYFYLFMLSHESEGKKYAKHMTSVFKNIK